jgi:hypothetical protein
MRIIYYTLTIIILSNCGNGQQNKNIELRTIERDEIATKKLHFTVIQLEAFLDSIGTLPPSLFT